MSDPQITPDVIHVARSLCMNKIMMRGDDGVRRNPNWDDLSELDRLPFYADAQVAISALKQYYRMTGIHFEAIPFRVES